jgi:enoyl-CoA hydratase
MRSGTLPPFRPTRDVGTEAAAALGPAAAGGYRPAAEEVPLRIAYQIAQGVAHITLDDGKANAMSVPWFAELGAALDRAQADGAGALVLRGRPRFFSGGLDLKLLPGLSPAELRELSETFARTMLRVHVFPIPTVACVTGHAIAGGAVLAFACDVRFATDGAFRIQMNEVAIGIPLPAWMAWIAESAVPATARSEVLLHARAFTPADALARGMLHGLGATEAETDRLASQRAAELRALDRAAYAESKRRLREAGAARALERLHEELGRA